LKNNITISPSLLSCDFLNIEKELKHFSTIKDIWLHLDVMDGHFVPNLTFGPPIIKMIAKKTTIPLDVHLMVTNPGFYIEELKDSNIHNFTFHYEALENDKEIISLIKTAKNHFKSVGISIKPKTSASVLNKEILDLVDLVLIMSVEPGFGGQSFIEDSILKIKQFSKYKKIIQVDGGINQNNIKNVINAGANNVVAGSYIFKSGPSEYKNKIQSLR